MSSSAARRVAELRGMPVPEPTAASEGTPNSTRTDSSDLCTAGSGSLKHRAQNVSRQSRVTVIGLQPQVALV